MDYGKSGNPKADKNEPQRKVGKKGLGAERSATGGKASKEELVARMKAAAAAKAVK
ncbi:hypothetical protein GCM10010873_07120 [Cypionkella aquatica]|uniref:Uncharacterized protein n=1 Tax=Cypionkella aquatica TaxID=1756042 RepID=A0AA37TR42_9RHOB|nr:hypothetical protein [Cypionkella aquatica]GLS85738.1 hypothetical protein GCM10010873_07120 [Cypionkella aquatica]